LQEQITGITKREYRNIVRSRLEEGKTYKLWIRIHSDELYHGRKQLKIKTPLRVVRFYPSVVQFMDREGRNVTYQYEEVYKMMLGDV
jgi:hypothetical protein